jgi:hypothetical protein
MIAIPADCRSTVSSRIASAIWLARWKIGSIPVGGIVEVVQFDVPFHGRFLVQNWVVSSKAVRVGLAGANPRGAA